MGVSKLGHRVGLGHELAAHLLGQVLIAQYLDSDATAWGVLLVEEHITVSPFAADVLQRAHPRKIRKANHYQTS